MENIVAAIFKVESEAYQALTEIKQASYTEGYAVAEAALVKVENGQVTMLDGLDNTGASSGQSTAEGMLLGSLIGILGGPVGVLLGAGYGALAGSMVDTADVLDSASLLEMMSGKLYEGEVAIVALVQEEEPAFDAPFEKFDTTIVRYDAAAVMNEVDRAVELEADLEHQAVAQMRAEKKAERKERYEDKKASLKERFNKGVDAYGDKITELSDKAEAKYNELSDKADAKIDDLADKADAKLNEIADNL